MALSPRDEESFSAFVRDRRHDLLRSACMLTAGDTHLAEDLVQTSLARLYAAWPRVRRGSPTAYTWRIIVNAHLDEVKRPRWRRERTMAELPDVTEPFAVPELPGGDAVRAALRALPPGTRAAVVLRYWADFSVADTARIMGCSQGTVKSQAAKGIARLRESLGSRQEARSL
jgi:RNA polymerase sigma-70 factor (sigma-E family)